MKALLAALLLAVCCAAPLARAQIGGGLEPPLPSPEQRTYSQDEIQLINAYMTRRVEAIVEGDTAAREKARAEILAPLRRPGVSVAFRQTVRAAIIDRLTAAADSADENVVVNVLFVLAEIADDSARLVVQEHTDDESQAVRYAAVGAMRRTFRVVDSFFPAIDQGRVGEMVAHLEGRLREEKDRQVSLAIVRALLQAGQIRREGFDAPASRGIVAAATGVGARLRQADEASRPLALLGGVLVGEDLAARLQTPGAIKPEIARAASAWSGEMLAYLAARAGKAEIPADRKLQIDLARLAERVVVLAGIKLGGSISEPGLATLLEQGSDQEFFDRARRYVLTLSGSPWTLPGADMKRIQDALDGG